MMLWNPGRGWKPAVESHKTMTYDKVMEAFTRKVIEIIKRIPEGRVCTYGTIALLAGQPRGARQVTRIIHSMSRKHDLPWFRIINARGKISLPEAHGYEQQKALLQSEGVAFDEKDRVDLDRYLWMGAKE
jgi:methylated-DNA-protein-cysteine methyltransferase-like protein